MQKIFQRVWAHKWKVFFVGLLLIGSFWWYQKDADKTNDDAQTIKSEEVRRGDVTIEVTGSGQLYAGGQADLRPQVAGDGLDVVAVYVKDGQSVSKGDRIATLDATDAGKAIRSAELDVWSAEIKMRQTEKLYKTKTENDRMMRQLQEAQLRDARNRLSDARQDAGDYTIKAPFDGIVTGVSVEAGDAIARDEILASVITADRYAQISLNEVDALKVSAGDKAVLTFDALEGVSIPASVERIDTIGTVEQGVVYFTAKITPSEEDSRLRPGMSVNVSILGDSRKDVLLVPTASVRSDTRGDFVFVIDESSEKGYARKTVEAGISDGIKTEVLSGVSQEDRVITQLPESEASKSDEASRGLLDGAVRTPGSGRR